MGACVSTVQSSAAKPAREVLCLGCGGSGKTLLIRQLKTLHPSPQTKNASKSSSAKGGASAWETESTVGVELDRLSVETPSGTLPLVVREVGAAMMPTWPSYLLSCHALVFVLDAANRGQLPHAAAALLRMLSDPRLLSQRSSVDEVVSVILVINKCDILDSDASSSSTSLDAAAAAVGGGLTDSEIEAVFRLDDLRQSLAPRVRLLVCGGVSARRPNSLRPLVDLLVQNLSG